MKVLVRESRGVKVVFTLYGDLPYGDVTPERIERETQELEHRFNQLIPITEAERAYITEDFDYPEEDFR